jgi:hypothetical protein
MPPSGAQTPLNSIRPFFNFLVFLLFFFLIGTQVFIIFGEISVSHDDEYGDDCLLGYCAV